MRFIPTKKLKVEKSSSFVQFLHNKVELTVFFLHFKTFTYQWSNLKFLQITIIHFTQ
jgi:hypothetical protein